MKVLIYGDFDPYQLGSSFSRAFIQLGHSVIAFDVRRMRSSLSWWLRSRIGHRATMRTLVLRNLGSREWNDSLEATARSESPDLLLLLNGEFVMPATLERIRRRGIPVFIFHADNPLPEHAAFRPETLLSALECDCYFIWSRVLAERLRHLGVRRVEYLPFAWDPTVFPYCATPTSPGADIVFIGGWDRDRERLLTDLAGRYEVRIWGPDYWRTRSAPRSVLRECWQGGALRAADAALVIAKARIVLNILRAQHHVDGRPTGVIMRTFEVPGAGGFLLSTRSAEALELLPEGAGGAYFSSLTECCAQIDHYLTSENDRRSVVAEAHSVVAARHLYTHRVQRILEVLQTLRP